MVKPSDRRNRQTNQTGGNTVSNPETQQQDETQQEQQSITGADVGNLNDVLGDVGQDTGEANQGDEDTTEVSGNEQDSVEQNNEPEVTQAPAVTEAPTPEPTPAPTLEPTPEPTPAPVVDTADQPQDDDVSEAAAYLENIRVNGKPHQKRILTALETFVEATKPRMPTTKSQGAEAQLNLVKHFLWLLDQEFVTFREGWNTALIFFQEHHDPKGGSNTPANYTALSEYRSNDFHDAWRDETLLEAYTQLITLLRATRNPATRKNERILLTAISEVHVIGERLANLQRFYSK